MENFKSAPIPALRHLGSKNDTILNGVVAYFVRNVGWVLFFESNIAAFPLRLIMKGLGLLGSKNRTQPTF